VRLLIRFNDKGDFSKTKLYFEKVEKAARFDVLDRFGREGVAALAGSTPVDSSLTANSWSYKIEKKIGRASISFHNSNVNKGVSIALILQYGHGTRNGGWVQGRDYINPSIQPVFDRILDAAWREVTQA
jgi:hypothetical protein